MIAIVVSRADSASELIGQQLLDVAEWTVHEDGTRPDGDGGGNVYRIDGFELREFDDLHLDLEGVGDVFDDPDLLVFASRHAGDSGPLLTAHFTGNFGPADYGGEPGTLARACPDAHAEVVAALARNAPDGYGVGVECTHHGPSEVGAPSMFVELGSDEPQWSDPEAARAVAQSILDIRDAGVDRDRQLVGFGGGHYAPRFTRIVRETEWAVGHIGADWALDAMGDPAANRDVVAAAFEASNAEYAVVDGERPGLESIVADLGGRVVSETWVREVEGVPLDLVADLEAAVCTVDEGLRFGDAATGYEGEFEVVALSTDLLGDVEGTDPDAARETVETHALAFETDENGARLAGRLAVASPDDREAIVDGLVAVLRGKYESVERTDGEVVARERAFDPEKARRLGIEEGPAFGRLSAGEPVEVDGTTVPPDAVTSERVRRYSI